jgi:hypothetical protein
MSPRALRAIPLGLVRGLWAIGFALWYCALLAALAWAALVALAGPPGRHPRGHHRPPHH